LNPNVKVGVALTSGGARAAYEVGVLKVIYAGKCPAADGNPVEVFCGTGAGALNAAVVASRLPGQYPAALDYLQSLWADEIPCEGRSRNNRVFRKRLDTLQFLDLPYMWRRPLKAFWQYFRDLGVVLSGGGPEIWNDTSPMRRLITESVNLEGIRDGEIARPGRSLRVIASDRGSGKARVFSNQDFIEEDGYSVVLASCSIPGFFPPVDIGGRQYAYGGEMLEALVQAAADAGCTVIHLIHTDPGASVDASAVRKHKSLAAVHQFRPRAAFEGRKGVLDFTRDQVEKAIAAGESDALSHNCAASGCIL
jgi:predicted acylesterase/phospholipase RssA